MKKTLKSILAFFAAAAVMLSLVPAALAATVDRMEVSLMYYGTEAPAAYRCSYTSASALEDKYERGIIIPMYVSTPGTVRINFTFEKLQKDMSVKVYTDQNCTNSPYNTSYFSVGDTTAEKYFSMTNAGTYYIKLYSNSYSADSDFENIIKMNVSEYTNSDKTIKSGQTIYYYRNSGTDKFYFKYTAAKTGKVTASLPYVYGSYLTLLNSKKKAVSEQEWISKTINGNRFSFAVKKGATYYFLVSTNGVSGGNIQSFSVKETAVKEKAALKKARRSALRRKRR